jgi:ABC-type antimicrobial peptide transport system permease subunit
MMVLGLLAAVALAMAAAGVYGVTTHSVAQRTRELGLRMALGAQSQDVVRLVIRQSLGMIAVGLGIGVVIALIVTRFMASLIYNVSETDVLTFASVVAVLGVVGLIASLIPAVRAGQVDAMQSLRE